LQQTKKAAPHKTSNRLTIIGFLVVFTMPIIFAWVAYFNGWYNEAESTNRGQWVKPVLMFEKYQPFYADTDHPVVIKPGETWKLVYPSSIHQCLDDDLDSICHINLYLLGQTHLALGKEANRLERMLLTSSEEHSKGQENIITQRFIDLKIVNTNGLWQGELSEDFVYIIDPVGNIILRYPIATKKEDVFLKGKDILYDLRKLLKLSRIG